MTIKSSYKKITRFVRGVLLLPQQKVQHPGMNYADLYRIGVVLRYSAGESQFMGKKIYFTHGLALLNNIKELFNSNCYFFTTSNPTPRILDCGAYIGLSIIYFKSIYPAAKITAFEADPSIYNVLTRNMLSFDFTDVELVNKAVWNEETQLTFYADNMMTGSLVTQNNDQSNEIKINTTRLINYLSTKIDFLKLDVEGAEYEVLKDIQHDLNNVDKIFIEYHSDANKPQILGEILQILSNAGFRYHIQEANNYTMSPFKGLRKEGFDLQLNIFGIR
jgi:FkbM family methyltransferase